MNGVAWEDTGIYEYIAVGMVKRGGAWDGCINHDDIINRYKRIDTIFEQVKLEHRIRTRKEVNPINFRESGGIYVHIGPKGKPYFGTGGVHRLAIARILELPIIPAQIGCIHESAIPLLPFLRQKDRIEH